MAPESEERRLAAILAADMVGYSRLMEADERGTIARQKAYRKELIDPTIAAHNGRIVKTTGDGLLVEFASVVDAVACAVEIQRAMGEREADVPEERRIQYRVGINLGDIVIDEDDIYGDGVNIAGGGPPGRGTDCIAPRSEGVSADPQRAMGPNRSHRPLPRWSRRGRSPRVRRADQQIPGTGSRSSWHHVVRYAKGGRCHEQGPDDVGSSAATPRPSHHHRRRGQWLAGRG